MREQTFQRLLKPHSFPLSWRDKKGAPGGIPSRKSRQGFRQNPRRDTQLKVPTGLPSEPPEGYPAEIFTRAFNKSYQGQCSHPAPAFVRGKKGFPLQIAGSMVEYLGIM